MNSTAWDPDVLGVLMAPLEGTTVPAWAEDALAAGLGSVILFGYNTPDPVTARSFAAQIHACGPETLVAIDEEGGDVSRLQAAEGSSLPSAWALGQVDDVALTTRAGRALGDLVDACGIDMALSPVLDVSTDPGNPVIGTRAFGDDPDRVARHARAFASGLRSAGVGVCGKHFPGHGATAVDSHTALPRIDLDAEEMRRDHLAPWSITPWLDAVMTAHILVPALGEGPASLSTWSAELLREVGHGGFHGLIITDSLDMAAVSEDPGYDEAVVRAFEAGANLLCLGTSLRRDDEQMVHEAHDALLAALEAGRIDRPTLIERARSTRSAARALRRRSIGSPLDIGEALANLGTVGAEAAGRAVELRQARLDTSPVVVADARVASQHASGSRPTPLVDVLRSRGIDTLVADYPGDLAPGRQVIVVTRLPRTDAQEAERLRAILRARPDAIVLHVGVPDAAPDHRHQVRTYGGGRAVLRAAVDLLLTAAPDSSTSS